MENKNFLKSEGIITFTDAAGRLMALKPDVTLSIVKNIKADSGPQKLYYNENVFRIEHRGEEYREISQMGLEYIGAGSGYDEAEVVMLAVSSLRTISDTYMLDLSHMGYISGLLTALGTDDRQNAELLELLRQKNTDALAVMAAELSLGAVRTRTLLGVAGLCGALQPALEQAEDYVLSAEMAEALAELRQIADALSAAGFEKNVRLDFSVINALDYYNGVVFRGYVREAPRAVLAGGRYDNLLRRFNKPQRAVGFALYLSELERAFHLKKAYDVDTLLLYGDAPAAMVAGVMADLTASGVSVRAESSDSGILCARRRLYMNENGEVSEHA